MRRRQTKPPGIVRRMFGFGRCPSPCRGERRRHVLLAEPVRLDKPRGPAPRLRVGDYAAGRVRPGERRSVPRSWCGRGIGVVTRVVHVPYVVEQDEDGVRCASAQLRPGVGAVGDATGRSAQTRRASAPGPTGCPLFHQAVIGFLRSPRQVAPGDPKPRAYSASCSGVIFTIGAPPPTLGGDATLQAKRQLHPTKYRPPRGRVYQASVVIPLSLRDPRDARRARVPPFTMDLLKAACYARRSGFVPTRARSGTFSRPGDGATGTRRGTPMEYPQGHRGACTRTVPKPVACCLNCRFVESFTRQRSCRPPQAA